MTTGGNSASDHKRKEPMRSRTKSLSFLQMTVVEEIAGKS